MRWYVALVMLAGVIVAAPMVGCGGDGEPTKTVTVEREVTVAKPASPRKHRRESRPQSKPTPVAPEFISCDSNIEAKVGTTTCPFAQNVFWTYWTSGESGDALEVWSPAAQASFITTCELDGAQVVCNTSDDATVKFAEAAIDSYSQAQADAYASDHDLGPDPYEGLSAPDSAPSDREGEVGQDCQGYDPCITPGPDVDCDGGEGDGPRYVSGPVYVDGADPYGLDSNYDGVGCEYG
jgi:hypothetical protein